MVSHNSFSFAQVVCSCLISWILVSEMCSRFRANFELVGSIPFEEKQWKEMSIGSSIKFNVRRWNMFLSKLFSLAYSVTSEIFMWQCIGESDRCSMITIDQETGGKVKEPMRSLSRLQKDQQVAMLLKSMSSLTLYLMIMVMLLF